MTESKSQEKPKTLSDAMQENLLLMKAMAAKVSGYQRKLNEHDDDLVRVMEVQTEIRSRLAAIEEAFHKAGVPGFKNPWWKKLFRVKNHLSHLEEVKNGTADASSKTNA